jgi:endonuclease YncB( thermonuclease family)
MERGKTMKPWTIALICCALASTTSTGRARSAEALPPGTIITGQALAIDGDTLIFTGRPDGARDITVRLLGIDAPEMDTPLGPTARGALDDLVDDQVLACDVVNTDRYKRAVAVCTTPAGDIATGLLAQGMAWTWRKYLLGRPEMTPYRHAERYARTARIGIWWTPQ